MILFVYKFNYILFIVFGYLSIIYIKYTMIIFDNYQIITNIYGIMFKKLQFYTCNVPLKKCVKNSYLNYHNGVEILHLQCTSHHYILQSILLFYT